MNPVLAAQLTLATLILDIADRRREADRAANPGGPIGDLETYTRRVAADVAMVNNLVLHTLQPREPGSAPTTPAQ